MSYEEEDTSIEGVEVGERSTEEEDTCMSYEEGDTCMSYQEGDTCMSYEAEVGERPCCRDGRVKRKRQGSTVSKETYYSVKRDLLQYQKRPTTETESEQQR